MKLKSPILLLSIRVISASGKIILCTDIKALSKQSSLSLIGNDIISLCLAWPLFSTSFPMTNLALDRICWSAAMCKSNERSSRYGPYPFKAFPSHHKSQSFLQSVFGKRKSSGTGWNRPPQLHVWKFTLRSLLLLLAYGIIAYRNDFVWHPTFTALSPVIAVLWLTSCLVLECM